MTLGSIFLSYPNASVIKYILIVHKTKKITAETECKVPAIWAESMVAIAISKHTAPIYPRYKIQVVTGT
jgi:hypothetical protein